MLAQVGKVMEFAQDVQGLTIPIENFSPPRRGKIAPFGEAPRGGAQPVDGPRGVHRVRPAPQAAAPGVEPTAPRMEAAPAMEARAEPLPPRSITRTVRPGPGNAIITDGPFAETKEQLAGFYIFDCQSECPIEHWQDVFLADKSRPLGVSRGGNLNGCTCAGHAQAA